MFQILLRVDAETHLYRLFDSVQVLNRFLTCSACFRMSVFHYAICATTCKIIETQPVFMYIKLIKLNRVTTKRIIQHTTVLRSPSQLPFMIESMRAFCILRLSGTRTVKPKRNVESTYLNFNEKKASRPCINLKFSNHSHRQRTPFDVSHRAAGRIAPPTHVCRSPRSR